MAFKNRPNRKEFSMRKFALIAFALLLIPSIADAGGRGRGLLRGRGGNCGSSQGGCSQGNCGQGNGGYQPDFSIGNCNPCPVTFPTQPTPAPTVAPALSAATPDAKAEVYIALVEVNQARARRGLRPFAECGLLRQAAERCAQVRAERRCHGHIPGGMGDFAYLPQGAHADAAGCGALEPSWGWGTCCTYENYNYAGAAMVQGNDGLRYMHLFVRR